MAKLRTIFMYEGTLSQVTSVRSKAYGNHIRAARGTKKPAEVNEAFKDSTGRLKQVNLFAKTIKDALAPYRKVFHDGTCWVRLLSLFRRQLKETGRLSWTSLEDFELIGKCSLARHFTTSVEVLFQEGENNLSVKVRSSSRGAPEKLPCDEYQQSLVVLFLGEKECVGTASHDIRLPVRTSQENEQSQTWPIPPGATTAVVAVGCIFFHKREPLQRRNTFAMKISKVVELV